MDRSQRRDQRRRAPGRQRRSDRSVVRKGRKLMRFKLTPYAQNSLALTHPDLVHFPSPANHRVGAIDEYDVRLSHDLEAPSDRKSVVSGKSVADSVDLGGPRIYKK